MNVPLTVDDLTWTDSIENVNTNALLLQNTPTYILFAAVND